MILKNQVEWALHCCAVLAGVPSGHYVSTKALAEFHGVPKEYLSKALQALSQNELVESTLGPSGGYRLARKPNEISFLDIVEAVEGRAPTFACTEIRRNNPTLPQRHNNPAQLPQKYSSGAKACAVARVMWEADAVWRAKLRSVKLSDLGRTLAEDVPEAVLEKSMAWLIAKE